MIYYVDFDRTLFNTKSFLNDFYEIINEYHIPKDEYIKKSLELGEGNFFKVLDSLKDNYPFTSSLYVDIERLIEQSKVYLYYDALVFLSNIKKSNNKLVLLTRGDFDFQNDKIDNSGIRYLFDKVIIMNDNKGDLDIDYQGVFIDDKIEEIESILKRNPYKVYLIDREHQYKSLNNKKVKLIHSLNEVEIKN